MTITVFGNSRLLHYLDNDSKSSLFSVSKEINEAVSISLLSELGIKPIEGYPAYWQFIGLFRLQCEEFCVEFKMGRTLLEAKNIADLNHPNKKKESLHLNFGIVAAISQIYLSCFYPIETITRLTNEVAQDIHPLDSIERLIPKACIPRVVSHAIVSKIDEDIKETHLHSIDQMLRRNFSEGLILALVARHPGTLMPYHIQTALERQYSDSFVLELLPHCIMDMQPYHIQTALLNEYNENTVVVLLSRCPSNLTSHNIEMALAKKYPESLILTLLLKYHRPINPSHILKAIQHEYSENLILRLMVRFVGNLKHFVVKMGIRHGYSEKCIALMRTFARH